MYPLTFEDIERGLNAFADLLVAEANTETDIPPDATPLLLFQPPDVRHRRRTAFQKYSETMDALVKLASETSRKMALVIDAAVTCRTLAQNASCAIHALPEETLRDIFTLVCNSLGDRWQRQARATTISHVCRKWRGVISGQSSLWRCLALPGLAVDAAEHIFERSKRRGLDLFLTHNWTGPFVDLNESITSRVKCLTIKHANSQRFLEEFDFISFSRLTELNLHGPGPFADVLNDMAFPELRKLNLQNQTRFMRISAPRLRELHVTLFKDTSLAWWFQYYMDKSLSVELIEVTINRDCGWTGEPLALGANSRRYFEHLRELRLLDLRPHGLSCLAHDVVAPHLETLLVQSHGPFRDGKYISHEYPDGWSEDYVGFRKMIRTSRHLSALDLKCAPPIVEAVLMSLLDDADPIDKALNPVPLSSLNIVPSRLWYTGQPEPSLLSIVDLVSRQLVQSGMLLNTRICLHDRLIDFPEWSARALQQNGCTISTSYPSVGHLWYDSDEEINMMGSEPY